MNADIQELYQGTLDFFEEILSIIGHDEVEAKTLAVTLMNQVLQLSMTGLLIGTPKPELEPWLEKLNQEKDQRSMMELMVQVGRSYAQEDIEAVFHLATKQVFGFYFSQVKNSLNEDQTAKLAELMNQVSQSASGVKS